MSLPQSWVDHLFKKLGFVYGHAFMDQYVEQDPAEVKQAWAECLAHYEKHPEALTFALDNLPADKPVNIMQFRNLCRQAPVPDVPALPPPAADPVVVARGQEKLKELAKTVRMHQPDPLSIVRNFEHKLAMCERLSPAQSDWLKTWYASHPKPAEMGQ
jgi:hypothetical protein